MERRPVNEPRFNHSEWLAYIDGALNGEHDVQSIRERPLAAANVT